MEKARQPLSARKPPEPSESHAGIDEWMHRRVMPDLQPLVQRLDASIHEAIPRLYYAVKWRNVFYGSADLGWLIEMAAYDVSVNVVFFGGADFDPPPPLGTTDRSRYVKVKTADEVETPQMRAWLKQAGRVPGWR
jgi:hypothetical protein